MNQLDWHCIQESILQCSKCPTVSHSTMRRTNCGAFRGIGPAEDNRQYVNKECAVLLVKREW